MNNLKLRPNNQKWFFSSFLHYLKEGSVQLKVTIQRCWSTWIYWYFKKIWPEMSVSVAFKAESLVTVYSQVHSQTPIMSYTLTWLYVRLQENQWFAVWLLFTYISMKLIATSIYVVTVYNAVSWVTLSSSSWRLRTFYVHMFDMYFHIYTSDLPH